MWLVFAIFSLFSYALADLFGKKSVDDGDALASLELLACTETVSVVLSLLMYVFRSGESGLSPWRLVLDHPLILLNVICFILYWLLFLLSMRFAGLSIEEAVSGAGGVFYFIGLIVVNVCTGKLFSIGEMLRPVRLIPILCVLIFTALLPNTELLARKRNQISLEKVKADRRKTILGLFLLIAAVAFDSLETIITTVIFDEGKIGTADYEMASYFANAFPLLLFFAIIRIKRKKPFIPFVTCNNRKLTIAYVGAAISSSVCYVTASSLDAVRTGILFIAYPIVPIIAAQVFLKEKYTWRQNLCIWMITASTIAFCIIDCVV